MVAQLPSLSPDDRGLLDAFIAADLDILTLHRDSRRPMATLLAWLDRMEPWLDALRRALTLRELMARELAIATLSKLIRAAPNAPSPPNPIEIRRAATTLLRSIDRRPPVPPRAPATLRGTDAASSLPSPSSLRRSVPSSLSSSIPPPPPSLAPHGTAAGSSPPSPSSLRRSVPSSLPSSVPSPATLLHLAGTTGPAP